MRTAHKTHYEWLEVSPNSTQDEIRKAYRRLAGLHHPDRSRRAATGISIMVDINHAYEVLSNPSSRYAYDKNLSSASTRTRTSLVIQSPTEPSGIAVYRRIAGYKDLDIRGKRANSFQSLWYHSSCSSPRFEDGTPNTTPVGKQASCFAFMLIAFMLSFLILIG